MTKANATARLWNVTNPTSEPAVLRGHEGDVRTVAFSSDGKGLASGGLNSSPILWDVNLESCIARACEIAGRNFTRLEWARYFGEAGLAYRKTCEQWPEGE